MNAMVSAGWPGAAGRAGGQGRAGRVGRAGRGRWEGGVLRAAIAVELRKARSARVLWSTGILVVVGVAVLAGSMIAAARSGNTEVTAKLGPTAGSGDWAALLGVAAQVTAAGALLAFGVGISWLTGREFADRTITGLFGLPVSRGTVAAAKLVVYAVWATVVCAALAGVLPLVGLLVGIGLPSGDDLIGLARQFALGLLTASIAVPAGWAASWGRGLLPGIATAVGILVVAQVAAIAKFGAWFPFVAPAFWAQAPSAATTAALLWVPLVPLVFGAATVWVWRRLQMDR
ncbi:MAG TPA: ABC transporter permease [Nakamurella sp.]